MKQLAAFALAIAAACASAPKQEPKAAAEPQGSEPESSGGQGAQAPAPAASRPDTPPRDPNVARLKIIGISDFHGWLLPLEPRGYNRYFGGIAYLAGMLEHKERLDPNAALILDNGDMWTGPTESTFLRGEPVIEAYNELGVAAANIANHEFDYGQEILRARIGDARFPFLGANIMRAGTDKQPGFVKPWVIAERDGVKVGIIGLTYVDTPRTTLAIHVQGLEFKPYDETLQRVIPEVRNAGAEVIVVLFHDAVEVAAEVIKRASNLGVHAVIAGQNHRKGEQLVGQTPVVNPGPFGRSYVRFDVEIDRVTRAVTSVRHEIVDVVGEVGEPPFPPSAKLAAIAEGARQKAKALAGEVLGKLQRPLPVGTFADSPLGHLVTDSWLAAFPDADIAILNHGGLRQPAATGPMTIGDLTAIMPFENNLYIVEVTGKQLKEQLAIDSPVVAGITWRYREEKKTRAVTGAVDRVGQPIDDAKKYSVIINDFMYFGGDGFRFQDLDATPEDTGLSWREPVIRALRLAESTGRAVNPPTGARAALSKGK